MHYVCKAFFILNLKNDISLLSYFIVKGDTFCFLYFYSEI